MPVTIIFMGGLLPEVHAITPPKMDPLRYTEPGGFDATFAISIKDGKIVAACGAPSYRDEDFNRCWVRASSVPPSILHWPQTLCAIAEYA